MALLIGFTAGFMTAWWIRTLEWKYRKWFVWIPNVIRTHNGQRLVVFGFWRKVFKGTSK